MPQQVPPPCEVAGRSAPGPSSQASPLARARRARCSVFRRMRAVACHSPTHRPSSRVSRVDWSFSLPGWATAPPDPSEKRLRRARRPVSPADS
eukprot:13514983-Alexandrium_andersonii.AAC.1